MFASIRRSWHLAVESYHVLRQDPELLVFPAVSFIALLIVSGFLGLAGLLAGAFDTQEGFSLLGLFFLFLFYLGTYSVTIYFQVGLVTSVQHRMAGGDPNVAYGLREANKRLGAILSWAVIAATVGMLLRMLERAMAQRGGGAGLVLGQLAVSLVGMAWSLAVFFVIPIIAAENVGGLAAVRRSVQIIRKRWGEAVVGQSGIGLVMFLVTAVVVGGLFFLGAFILGAVGPVSGWILVGVFAPAMVALLLLIAFSSALQSTYTAALYRYATTGQVGAGFPADELESAFRPQPSRIFGLR